MTNCKIWWIRQHLMALSTFMQLISQKILMNCWTWWTVKYYQLFKFWQIHQNMMTIVKFDRSVTFFHDEFFMTESSNFLQLTPGVLSSASSYHHGFRLNYQLFLSWKLYAGVIRNKSDASSTNLSLLITLKISLVFMNIWWMILQLGFVWESQITYLAIIFSYVLMSHSWMTI